MLRTKRRRALALVILVSSVLLLPVQTAGAAPRRGEGREGVRSAFGILARWEHQAWSFWTGLLDKAGNSMNPDGLMSRLVTDDGH